MAESLRRMEVVQKVLSLQAKAGKSPAEVVKAVAGLKDLCDIHETNVEWRRGTSQHSGGERPMFRNGSNGSMSPVSPRQGFQRVSSTKSFGSTSAVSTESPVGSTSPVVKAPATYTPMKYQSKFVSANDGGVNDKILNNIILSKMNKFSPSTYNDVRDFLYQILGSDEPGLAEMIRHFMHMVFKKAASEEIYCSLYAKLLCEISTRYKVILEEMNVLQENYLSIFDDVEEAETSEGYATFVEKNIEKRYRRGYSQFLAELAMLEIIELSHLEKTFTKIFEYIMKGAGQEDKKTIIEEYTDCLLRMSRVFKGKHSKFTTTSRILLLRLSGPHIEHILKNKDSLPSISPKARFTLMDVKDNLSG